MPGAVTHGFHEGSRSEHLAHPVFSAFGTAVPVPYSEDFGLDFYCTLMERQQQVLVPLAYYAVQVKSNLDPWAFETSRAVRWFVECPMSIFLCVVTKSESRIRIYHTSPRFYAWVAHSQLPDRLELIPDEGTEGRCTQWSNGTSFSLSAPILDCRLDQPDTDEEFRARAAGILKFWIDVDEQNLKNVRMNLREFKMPDRYQTNTLSPAGTVIHGSTIVSREDLERAVSHLKDPLSGVADQLFRHGDLLGAVRGMLLLRQLYWGDRHQPSALTWHANSLNFLLGKASTYFFEALDSVGNGLDVKLLASVVDSKLLARVHRIYLTGREVTDSIIAPLQGARELKWLHLCNTSITNEGLKYLQELTELRELLLGDTPISDAGLKLLFRLEKLTILNLARTKVTSEGMRHLNGLARLENLYLNETEVDDEGLRCLGELPRLEVITLNGTRVTDNGLTHLRASRCLRKLYRSETKITDRGAEELQKVIPGLVVIPPPPN